MRQPGPALFALALLSGLCLSACQNPSASAPSGAVAGADHPPAETNTCWRLNPGAPRYVAVARETPNETTCAVYLEGLRLQEGHDMAGVWNGVFIWVTKTDISASLGRDGSRYALISPADRARIDDSLKDQIAAKAAARPATTQP